MDRLEEQLRSALRQVEPPPDFAARVIARAEEQEHSRARHARPQSTSWWRMASLRWAVAAVLAIAIIGGFEYRQHRERVAGEAAKAQLMLALRIAGSKLQIAQSKVQAVATHDSQPTGQESRP